MRQTSLFIFLSLFAGGVYAQLLNQPEAKDLEIYQKFKPSVVMSHNILEITCEVGVKKDGQKIRDGYVDIYRFYENGNIEMISRINEITRDTAITYFEYSGHRLKCEVKNDIAGMFSYCYAYDAQNRPTEVLYGRANRIDLELNKIRDQTPSSNITTETYIHKEFEGQLHTTLHNASGRPYQKEIRYFNGNGYLVKYLRNYILTSGSYQEDYSYNERGWLSQKQVRDGNREYRIDYVYDPVGNLLEENRFEGETQTYHKEIVYNRESMLITAELTREDPNSQIVINTYRYKFRPSPITLDR